MKQKFECTSCGYKFTPKTERVPNRCPYCSKPGIRPIRRAQDIVNEAIRKEW